MLDTKQCDGVFTSDEVFGIFWDLPPVGVVELGIFSQGVSEGPQLGEVPERLPEKEIEIQIKSGRTEKAVENNKRQTPL